MLKTTPAVRPASILFRSLSVILISALLVPTIVVGESGSSESTLQRALVRTASGSDRVPAAPVSAPPEPFHISASTTPNPFASFTANLTASLVSLMTSIATSTGATTNEKGVNSDETTLESPPAPMSPPVPTGSTEFDFDGDNKADIGRWRTLVSTTEYSIMNSSGGGSITTTTIGSQSAKLAPADFDGDGKTDLAVFDAGLWTIKKSSDGSTQTITGFGQAGDIPVPGNYAGDAAIDAALYRPSNSTWYVREAVNGTVTSQTWGQTDDIPVAGNYDGDGVTDLAVFRPSTGVWYIIGSTSGNITRTWGTGATDTPVPADFDGDGKTDIAVFRKSTGIWYIFTSLSGFTTWTTQSWGNYGDQPVPADYDADGKADFAIWRPKTGVWWLVHSNNSSIHTYVLGVQGDKAVPSAYLKQVAGSVPVDDLAKARLSPKNATGGTNLYSQNFSWGSNLVSLPGRAGLDLSLGIGYNSLVWTKADNEIFFDTDNANVSPGFRLGFPTIEPVYYDDDKSKFAYMMVTPSGSRIEFRQTAVSGVYETADSSYAILTTTGAPNPNDPVADITITVTTTDGTKMKYEWKVGTFRCTQIKDRNGNYISAVYNIYGNLDYVTDTLGRVIKVRYVDGYPSAIEQAWGSGTNGSGELNNIDTSPHTWATFTYRNETINTNFGSMPVIGPPNETVVKVLEKVTYADLSSTKFEYNGYAQVKKVENFAPNGDPLNHVRTNLDAVPATPAQTDCPRFTRTFNKATHFYGGLETEVINSAPAPATVNTPVGTENAVLIEVSMTNHPHNAVSKTYVGSSGWREGLPIQTEDWADGTSGTERKRWTWMNYTQDDTNLTYILNPRVVESRVGDTVNVKKTAVTHKLYPGTTVAEYGLVSKVEVFDSGLSNVIKRVETDYNLATAYTDKRIIGLPLETRAWGKNDVTQNLEQVSRMTYVYDGEAFDLDLEPNQIPALPTTTHNTSNYPSTFVVGRGNLTSTTRHDVTGQTAAVTSKTRYDIAGSVVAKLDPLDRKVRIEYTDAFNDLQNRNTFAYPTKVYDPANNFSEVKYRYDIGANVWAKSPTPYGGPSTPNSQGKITEREYDDKGRLLIDKIVNHGGAYTRYEYPTNGIQSKVFLTVIDTNTSGTGDTADEVLSESWADGAGRVRRSRTEHPGSSGGWSGSIAEYDILGRVKRSSVPTEISVPDVNNPDTWAPAGDDLTRGWLWTYRKYDWKGRVVRKINTDGIDQTTLNDSDVLITYEGCGCAGGQVTTIQSENVPRDDQPTLNARRTRKAFADILGRSWKTVAMKWDGTTPYTTTEQSFNGRDQIVRTRQIDNTTADPQVYQDHTTEYDGHGRVWKTHDPEQINPNNTPAFTTTSYNADDSVASVTDARGTSANYTYNNLGLLTLTSFSVPLGSTILVTPDVSHAYDELGNRTSMVDASGTTTYQYNELSQIISETKQFNGLTGLHTLSYEYTLGGGLKTMNILPNNTSISYAYDDVGRVNSVSGQGFLNGTYPVTNLVSNIEYRAWNRVKAINYGSSYNLAVAYDNNLKVSSFQIPTLMELNYQYYADGRAKFADDILDGKFDRSYTYDHQQRLATAKTGDQANGGSQMTGPYNESYGFDAFDNPTSRDTTHWSHNFQFQASYTNNRRNGWQYDQSGNVATFDNINNYLDAAQENTKVVYPEQIYGDIQYDHSRSYSDKTITYDGDAQPVIEFSQTNEYRHFGTLIRHDMRREKKEYNLKSSVLSGAVVYKYATNYFWTINGPVTSNLTFSFTNVFLHGKLLGSMQHQYESPSFTTFEWNHVDPTATSIGVTQRDATQSWKYLKAALDPTGADVGLEDPYIDPDPPEPPPPFHGEFASPEAVEMVEVDGVLTPLSLFPGMAAIVSQCPKSGCGAIKTENGWEYWTAFADGYEGYMPTNGHYAGNGQWSSQTQQERNRNRRRNRSRKPTLKTAPARAKGSPRPTVNEADLEQPIIPNPFDPNGGFHDTLRAVIGSVAFVYNRTKFVGFSSEEESGIANRLLMTIFWKPCADAYRAFPGIKATPGEVLRDRGITFINAPSLRSTDIEAELGIDSEQRTNLLSHVTYLGFYFGNPETTGAPNDPGQYERLPNQRIFIVLNLGSRRSNLDEDVFHGVVHGGGVMGEPGISGGRTSVHDLSNYGTKYENILKACKPFAK